jgi:hypothetical protein
VAYPLSYPIGTKDFFLEVQRQQREIIVSPSPACSSPNAGNEWDFIVIPHYSAML